ncbi:MAG: protein kinase [Thermoanaerobaculales bacterium]|nr:protein kinase [Thermoanaerobaculales bacterium]
MPKKRIGRYEILDTLGKGAMGVVYLARDPMIDRRVALKTLRLDVDAEVADEFRERFLREAKAAGRLNHPGIVTVHDVGEDPETGLVYIAMEYVKGRDLKQVLASEERLRPSEAARIVAEVALALEYAHGMGVIHRDIKPANIILTADGFPKVMDFGVARLESSNLTVEGQFIGTPNFMSPEQITGKTVDGRSDLFSLGVVLFNLLTGRRPFVGANMHEITLKIAQEPCPIPSTMVAGLAPAFNPILLKCLEKDPEQRFQSGTDIARVLAALSRSLSPRSEGDSGRTGVGHTDLEGRIAAVSKVSRTSSPRTAAIARPKKTTLSDRLRSLPLPEFVHWQVNSSRIWPIIGGCLFLGLAPILILAAMVDHGPWPSPSDAAMHGFHETARSYRRAIHSLEQDDLLAAEKCCLRALHQSPASPGGRALMARIRAALDSEKNILATRDRIEKLVMEGREFYRQGDYKRAITLFEEVMDLGPGDELATSYLELANERLRAIPKQTPARTTRRVTKTTPERRTPIKAQPTPGLVRITLLFNSPINSGKFVVTIDGEPLTEIPFDFTRKNFLKIKRKGTGTVKRALTVPSGRRTIGIEFLSPDLGKPVSAQFTEQLLAGSQWSLRVDQPSAEATPSFFFVKSR